MARLTKAIKEKILHNALTKANVFERELDVKAGYQELAELVRLHAIGGVGEEKKLIELSENIQSLIDRVPDCVDKTGYFHLNNEKGVKASFGGMQLYIYYNGVGDKEKHVWKSPAPNMFGKAIMFGVDHELTIKFHSIKDESKKAKDLKTSIQVNVNAMLDSVTTDKKLIEIWPESKELIPTEIEKKKVQLPSTSVDQLNTMIGIPSDE